ncbi:hypothetical protein EV14_2387 [Prochlorococcus sp. MIT 0703]|nr:hypothetical protein EV12_1529 [Prochlorococcus sp. MIT 0701]KGG31436.1 hypothetical protein EV14_2387 [Prochlorococcus sp. MIT 0703]
MSATFRSSLLSNDALATFASASGKMSLPGRGFSPMRPPRTTLPGCGFIE